MRSVSEISELVLYNATKIIISSLELLSEKDWLSLVPEKISKSLALTLRR